MPLKVLVCFSFTGLKYVKDCNPSHNEVCFKYIFEVVALKYCIILKSRSNTQIILC